MSYPEPRYLGDGGAVTAVLHPRDSAADIDNPPANATRYLATGASTDGLFGLYRWDFGPTRSGPDPHFHRTLSESFFVLSGTIRVHDGTGWKDAEQGDFLHVPAGGVHGFRNESGQPASMLLLFVPGAPREEYFEVLAEIAQGHRPPMDDDERAAFMQKHDTYWL